MLTTLETTECNELELLNEDELLRELRLSIAMTVRGVVRAARVWAELERRGVALGEFRSSLQRVLPRVAAQILLPEAVVEFMGDPRRLDVFSRLDISEQRAVMDRGEVDVYRRDANRAVAVPIATIPLRELRSVVDGATGRLRPIDQQEIIDRRGEHSNEERLTRVMLPERLASRIRNEAGARGLTVAEFLADMVDVVKKGQAV
jgi:hypothetical protein